VSTIPSLDALWPALTTRPALKRMGSLTAIIAAAGLVAAFLAPKWYTSAVTVAPIKSQRGGLSGLSSLLGGDGAGIAASFEAMSGGGAEVQRIAAVLESTAVSDAVIARFGLLARYRETTAEGAREALWSHCAVKPATKAALVTLTCEDQDPAVAQAMVVHFAEVGNELFRKVGISSATEEARFLERRVAELRQQAADAAAKVRAFQEEHRIVDIESQSRSVVSALGALQTQRIGKQVELDVARSYSGEGEATIRQLESQLAAIDRGLLDLQGPSPAAAVPAPAGGPRRGQGLLPPALSVPKLRAEYETLYRDRKVVEASLIFALDRLEGAKANEARDTSTFQVLDPPTVATRKTRPKRLRWLFVSVLAGLLLAAGLEVVRLRRAGGLPGAGVDGGHPS
jgi:capsule polysaccharide export protein KpsE/RkpR